MDGDDLTAVDGCMTILERRDMSETGGLEINWLRLALRWGYVAITGDNKGRWLEVVFVPVRASRFPQFLLPQRSNSLSVSAKARRC